MNHTHHINSKNITILSSNTSYYSLNNIEFIIVIISIIILFSIIVCIYICIFFSKNNKKTLNNEQNIDHDSARNAITKNDIINDTNLEDLYYDDSTKKIVINPLVSQ
jgi:flagellar basal body-associated protein FliL